MVTDRFFDHSTPSQVRSLGCERWDPQALLPSVDFVAIDEEMTGIGLPGVQEAVGDLTDRRSFFGGCLCGM